MRRTLQTALVVLSGLAASACSDRSDFRWYDTTGQDRGTAALLADLKYCDKVTPVPKLDTNHPKTVMAFQFASFRHDDCMKGRGWKLR